MNHDSLFCVHGDIYTYLNELEQDILVHLNLR
jgi:hypothetical protein